MVRFGGVPGEAVQTIPRPEEALETIPVGPCGRQQQALGVCRLLCGVNHSGKLVSVASVCIGAAVVCSCTVCTVQLHPVYASAGCTHQLVSSRVALVGVSLPAACAAVRGKGGSGSAATVEKHEGQR